MEEEFTHVSGSGLVMLEGITLKVALVGIIRQGGQTIAQFRVESVDKGEGQWHALIMSDWQLSS